MKPKVIDRVNIIEDDRGYLNSKQLTSVSLDNVVDNGLYKVNTGCTNLPPNMSWGYLQVIKNYDGYCSQEFTGYYGQKFTRGQNGGTWSSWTEVATTDKVFGVKNPNYTGNIDELYVSGQYILQNPFSGTLPNNLGTGIFQWSVLNVYGGGDSGSMLYQDLTVTNHTAYSSYANKYYRRIRFGAKWSDWQELATTTKTTFTCTPASGYTLSEQVCYKTNNEFYISLKISKTGGASFVQNGRIMPLTVPFNVNGVVVASTMGKVTNTEWSGVVNAYANGNQVFVIPMASNLSDVYVTLKGGIA